MASETDLDRLSSVFSDSGGASMVESKLLYPIFLGGEEWRGR